MMEEMVKSGRLGRKSGKGFYEVSGVHRHRVG
jgi:3-hydroxyacyl-CoA dehydrogenase